MYGTAKEIKPMKAWKLPKGKEHMRKVVCESGEYFGQVKKDGYWYMFEKDGEGNCYLFSRNPDVATGKKHLNEKSANVPHIIKYLNTVVPDGSILIGEIYYPNKTSKDVTPIMGSKPEKAIERQNGEYGLIHYYIHDILAWAGNQLTESHVNNGWTHGNRQDLLMSIMANEMYFRPNFIEYANPRFDTLDEWIDELIESGEEGAILKKSNEYYCPDKKPAWNWIKFKIEDDHDVICAGYEPPKKEYKGTELETWEHWEAEDGTLLHGNYYHRYVNGYRDGFKQVTPVTESYFNGWIGAIRMEVYKDGQRVDIGTVKSGLTHELLEEIKENPMKYANKPMAVKCMMVGDGALRHPAFDRFRDDIPEEDCTWDKIFS